MPGRPLTNGTGEGAQNGSSAAAPTVTPDVAAALARPVTLQLWGPGFLGRLKQTANGQLRYDIHQSASTDSRIIQTVSSTRVKGYSAGARACRHLTRAVNRQGLAQLAGQAIAANHIEQSDQPEFINGFGLGFIATATQIVEANPNAAPRYIGS